MRKFLASLVLGTALALSGCAVFGPVDSDFKQNQSESTAVQTTKKLIEEAGVLITAVSNVVVQNLEDGVMLPDEAMNVAKQLKEADKALDQAEALLQAGDVLGAKNKAELTRQVILVLHKQVAAKARAQ